MRNFDGWIESIVKTIHGLPSYDIVVPTNASGITTENLSAHHLVGRSEAMDKVLVQFLNIILEWILTYTKDIYLLTPCSICSTIGQMLGTLGSFVA